MPLVTEVTRDDETVDHVWDYATLSAMFSVALAEACPDLVLAKSGQTMREVCDGGQFVDMSMFPLYYVDWDLPLLKEGRQVLNEDWSFGPSEGDPEERVIEFKAGDVLHAHREMR